MSIYSATFDINNAANFYKQALWAGIGLGVMLVLAFIPLRTVQRLSFAFYFTTIAILSDCSCGWKHYKRIEKLVRNWRHRRATI